MQSDTTAPSPTPLSPFSSAYSIGSDETGTSEEPGDLGAFTSIFRVLNQLRSQPPSAATSTTHLERSHWSESDTGALDTSWSQDPPSFYLSASSIGDAVSNVSPSPPSEGEQEAGEVSASDTEGEEAPEVAADDLPSLGLFGSAFDFLAAERARLEAQLSQRAAAGEATGIESAQSSFRHVVEPRRKRRRKRKASAKTRQDGHDGHDGEDEDEDGLPSTLLSSSDQSSSPPPRALTPTLPKSNSKSKRYLQYVDTFAGTPRLAQAHLAVPSSIVKRPLPPPPNPRLQRLRNLARKLSILFPHNADTLKQVLLEDSPGTGVIDPRGPDPNPDDKKSPLVFVFIDHSNILVGFLSWLKRQASATLPSHQKHKPPISHEALCLLLERGRSVSRRALVASSPLHQPLESAQELGYDVSVLQRVAVVDEIPSNSRGKARRPQNGESTESDVAPINALPLPRPIAPRPFGHRHHRSSSGTFEGILGLSISPQNTRNNKSSRTTPSTTPNSNIAGNNRAPRARYREQAVDELLQLKIMQSLLDTPLPPPSGSTIVLATGDGASSQFNQDGFLGCARHALERGWKVELVAWESGVSRSWATEFTAWGRRFEFLGLERFGLDLLEVL